MADDKTEQQDQTKQNTTLFNMCQVSLDGIFKQMHDKAIEQTKSIAKVQNSIFDESGKFHGAGSHIIAALPNKEETIDSATALNAIQTYVQWFSGPDIKDKITEDSLIPLEDENTSKEESSNAESNESIEIEIPSFLQYIGEAAEDEEQKQREKNDTAEKERAKQNAAKKKEEKRQSTTAKGYYITYKLEIEGQKETPLSDAFKSFGKGLLKGIGIQSFSWRSGAKGKEYTIGGLMDTLDQVFGKINPEELRTRFAKNAKAKYPQSSANDVQFYDQKTILQYLKGKLEQKDIQKIKTADYSLCYKVPANDKSKKLINTTVVADFITRSIKGIFKKFKNAVKKDDVILVNDYNETNKDQKKVDKKLEPTEGNGKKVTSDSIVMKQYRPVINEDTAEDKRVKGKQDDNIKAMTDELNKLAKSALGENFEQAIITMPKSTITKIEKDGVKQTDNPDLYAALNDDKNKDKHVFVLKTKHSKQEDNKKPEGESISINPLMDFIFEAADDKTSDSLSNKVDSVFKSLYANFKKILPTDKQDKMQDPKVHKVEVPVKTESLTRTDLSKLKIFEDCEIADDISKLLLEKGHQRLDDKKWQAFKKMVKGNLDDIRSKKDEILKSSYEDQGQMLSFTKGDEAENNSYNDFVKELFDTTDSEEDTLKKLNKIAHRDNFRNDIVYRFKYKPSEKVEEPKKEDSTPETHPEPVPEEIKKVSVKFFDYDPANPDNEEPETLKDEEVEVGSSVTPPASPKHKGFEFVGWKPNDFDNIQEPKVYVSQYKGIEPQQYPVTFFDMDFENRATVEIDTTWVEEGKSAKAPTQPDHEKEGWKFKGWSADFSKVTQPMNIIAEYDQIIKINPKAPKDPEKPEDLEPIGDPIEYDPEKSLEEQLPDPPDFKDKGFEFKKWNPDPTTIKDPKEDIDITAEYAKTIKISPKAPKNPEKPTEQLEPIGEPFTYDPSKSLEEQLPDPPEKDGWEPDGWNPDPSEVKDPKEDINIVARYKKVGEASSESSQVSTYWICIDENGFLDSSTNNTNLKVNHTDVDFYIVPMKNLKMDNTDDDDEKAVSGAANK